MLNYIIFLYNIFIIQQDNIYEIKEKKKDDLKIQNLITSTKVEFQIIQKSINLM